MVRTFYFTGFLVFLLMAAALLGLHRSRATQSWLEKQSPPTRQIVNHLQLTDLALWTEARYTRNPSLADYFTPFQDFPGSFEHFPAGSIIAPQLPAVETKIIIRPQ